MDLRDAFLRLSLVRQRPATQDRTECHPLRKSLLHGEADGGFCAFLGSTHLATQLMEQGSSRQGVAQAMRVGNVLRQGQRLLVLCQPLVRRAQVPQCPGSMAAADHASVLPREECMGAVLLGIVEGYALYKVRVC